jgi:hypothetical protein
MMMVVFGVAVIVLVATAIRKNKPGENLGFPASRKAQEAKRKKERNGQRNT